MSHPRMPLNVAADVNLAWRRIRPDVAWTPVESSPVFRRLVGADVFIKWESEQKTGSFKFRGALNKLRCLSADERKKGVVSASTGNHGLGLSLAAQIEAVPLTLVLPKSISEEKRRRLEAGGVDMILTDGSCEKAEARARRLAADTGRVYISPYNDFEIIAGQGTIGRELLEDLREFDGIVVPVGGGGLVSGVAAYLRAINPRIRVFGVEPVHSAFMAASLKAGRLVDIEEKTTIAEAVAGGIEPGSVTFGLCRELIDDIVLVEESAISKAMAILFAEHGRMVEGAGALAAAALLREAELFRGKRTVLVASGGNIAPSVFRTFVSGK